MLSVGLTFESQHDAHAAAGLVGPNAVIQLGEALRVAGPIGLAETVFASAGYLRLLHSYPDAMIGEAIPARLFEALWRELSPEQAACIAHDAGRRTGAYVLANRIPAFVRTVLRALPERLSARLLLKAIRKNAWTFAGSGMCRVAPGKPAIVEIANNPLAMPGCVWHIGVFECLFRALIREDIEVRHSARLVGGTPTCRFEIDCAGLSGSQKRQRIEAEDPKKLVADN